MVYKTNSFIVRFLFVVTIVVYTVIVISSMLFAASFPVVFFRTWTTNMLIIAMISTLSDWLFVLLRHFVIVFSHFWTNVIFVMGNLFNYIEERWYTNLFLFLSGFDSQKRWLTVNIQKGLHKEILLLVNETLPHLFENLLVGCPGLFILFNEFTCRYLSSFLNPFITLVGPHLMTVRKRVVFTCFSKEILFHVTYN